MIEFNKVTWYSRIAALVLFIGIIPALSFYLGMQYQQVTTVDDSLSTAVVSAPAKTFVASATYTCDGGKSITAAYFDGPKAPMPEPGQPPIPTGSVEVSLDGGATSTLKQTISADGARYANADESFVFWNKGNTALIMRNNTMDLTYTNCATE